MGRRFAELLRGQPSGQGRARWLPAREARELLPPSGNDAHRQGTAKRGGVGHGRLGAELAQVVLAPERAAVAVALAARHLVSRDAKSAP
eukprot:11676798-Alexandrium_andersonii.AAC.1